MQPAPLTGTKKSRPERVLRPGRLLRSVFRGLLNGVDDALGKFRGGGQNRGLDHLFQKFFAQHMRTPFPRPELSPSVPLLRESFFQRLNGGQNRGLSHFFPEFFIRHMYPPLPVRSCPRGLSCY